MTPSTADLISSATRGTTPVPVPPSAIAALRGSAPAKLARPAARPKLLTNTTAWMLPLCLALGAAGMAVIILCSDPRVASAIPHLR
jgi:hypothetical protein